METHGVTPNWKRTVKKTIYSKEKDTIERGGVPVSVKNINSFSEI